MINTITLSSIRAQFNFRAVPLFYILLVATFVATFQIGAAPLWYDESGTMWMAELPLARLLAATAADTHPPLYLIIISIIRSLVGPDRALVRLFSAACILTVLVLAFHIGTALGLSRRAKLVAVALLALSPFQQNFAQEARMYGLFELEIMLAVFAILHRRWGWVAVAGALALYTHNYALIYWPVLAFLALYQFATDTRVSEGERLHWRKLVPMALAFAAPLVAFVPWAIVLAGQMRAVANGYWIQPTTPGAIIYCIYMMLWAFKIPAWAEPTAVMLTGATVIGLVFAVWRARQPAPLYLLALFLGPLAVAVTASLLWHPILLFRGLAPSVPALALLLGWAVDRLSLRHQIYATVLYGPLVLAALINFYLLTPEHKAGTTPYAQQILAQWQPGDIVLHSNEGSMMEMHQTRLGDGTRPNIVIPRCATPNIGGLSAGTMAAMGIVPTDPEALRWQRAWLIVTVPPTIAQCEVDTVQNFLDRHPHERAWVIRDDEFVDAAIYLVQR